MMHPSFPSKTFPNHYTIVTGLYPESHGIVSNTMYDPITDEHFSLSNQEAITDASWWGGEPVRFTRGLSSVACSGMRGFLRLSTWKLVVLLHDTWPRG